MARSHSSWRHRTVVLGRGFLLTCFGCRTANEVICWSPFIIYMHTHIHAYIYVDCVCVYIIMEIYTYLYVLSVRKICTEVLAPFTLHETFKLISSLLQDAQHALIRCRLLSLSPNRQRLEAMPRKSLWMKCSEVTLQAESQFQK